jgi:uncharacterized protein YndB with AHSA1/START domain
MKERRMATLIENTIEIARPLEDVFDYLSDLGNEVRWNPDCLSMEQLTDGAVGVGTRFRAKWKQGPVIFPEVTAYVRPRTWTYVNGGSIACALTITLEPTSSGGTRLTSRGLWSANGFARLFFPVFIRSMRKAEVEVVANARRALEAYEDRTAA